VSKPNFFMTDGTAKLALSVVVSTVHEPCAVIEKFGGLRRQISALEGELVVVSLTEARTAPPSDVCVHHIAEGSIFDCRAAAPALASGQIIAFTEDHCELPPDWCERILQNFSTRPGLVMLGGAVANGSTRRIEDLMNYWMTFATFAPGQVTARHPCVAQIIVRASAIDRALQPGELETALVRKLESIPDAIYVDANLVVTHEQSHGFWQTFAAHYHNGRATAALTRQTADGRGWGTLRSLRSGWRDARNHFRRTKAAFRMTDKPFLVRTGYGGLILPLIVAHGIGAVIGYRRGPGTSPQRLV
jgi:hypothetical protein